MAAMVQVQVLYGGGAEDAHQVSLIYASSEAYFGYRDGVSRLRARRIGLVLTSHTLLRRICLCVNYLPICAPVLT
eukprot:2589310-Rhodomonas_salina.2